MNKQTIAYDGAEYTQPHRDDFTFRWIVYDGDAPGAKKWAIELVALLNHLKGKLPPGTGLRTIPADVPIWFSTTMGVRDGQPRLEYFIADRWINPANIRNYGPNTQRELEYAFEHGGLFKTSDSLLKKEIALDGT